MAVIGTLGDTVFAVSRKQINTIDSLKWDSAARYATHERHLKDVLLEFTGTEPDTISFAMYFSVFLGVNPIAEITKLLNAERNGKIMRLVIGGKSYGRHKWVITALSKSLEKLDNEGSLLVARVNVSLTAYAER